MEMSRNSFSVMCRCKRRKFTFFFFFFFSMYKQFDQLRRMPERCMERGIFAAEM